MVDDPEFEAEFYIKQNEMMKERYAKIFSKWKLSWNSYYNYVSRELKEKDYWIWIFLCGFEKFLQEQGSTEINRRSRLYKDAEQRIRRIIGDYFKNQEYVRTL